LITEQLILAMPNGRSRQTNTRAANRRRNIQRQREVNAVAVAAPLVIQAELVQEDISILKEKIKQQEQQIKQQEQQIKYYEDKIRELPNLVVDLNSRGAKMSEEIWNLKNISFPKALREIKALRENEKVAIKVFEQNKELKKQIDSLKKYSVNLKKMCDTLVKTNFGENAELKAFINH